MSRTGGGGFGGGGAQAPGSVKGVFISHTTEDAPLANAFSELIHDVSSGMIPSYSSSSKDKAVGIPYGDDWFLWIQDRIRESGNVVALITPISVGQPWILFEAGFGKAMEGTRVFGLRLGTTAEEAYVGPFKAFQNSASEPEDILKLCRQLFDGTPCQPRDETVQLFVAQFLTKVKEHFKSINETPKQANPESEAVFRALEEMKGLVQIPRGYGDEWDDMKMMELGHLMHMAMRPAKEIDPALRVTLLLGVAIESGFGWIVPTIQQALREPIDLNSVKKIIISGDFGFRRMRRTPFPPGMLVHELLQAVRHYQKLRFGPRRLRKLADEEEKGE